MTRILASTCAVLTLAAGPVFAQAKATITGLPEIPFTTVANFLKLPPGEYLGESVAVATNSKGNIYVFHRRDTTRLFEFDKNGSFLREIGRGTTASNSPTRSRLLLGRSQTTSTWPATQRRAQATSRRHREPNRRSRLW